MIAAERLWLTADRDELVHDGDKRAAFLFTTPGKTVSAVNAERFGLVDGRLGATPIESVDERPVALVDGVFTLNGVDLTDDGGAASPVVEKQVDEHEDKQVAPAEDKASGLTVTRKSTRKRSG